jgi:hypothetical protein
MAAGGMGLRLPGLMAAGRRGPRARRPSRRRWRRLQQVRRGAARNAPLRVPPLLLPVSRQRTGSSSALPAPARAWPGAPPKRASPARGPGQFLARGPGEPPPRSLSAAALPERGREGHGGHVRGGDPPPPTHPPTPRTPSPLSRSVSSEVPKAWEGRVRPPPPLPRMYARVAAARAAARAPLSAPATPAAGNGWVGGEEGGGGAAQEAARDLVSLATGAASPGLPNGCRIRRLAAGGLAAAAAAAAAASAMDPPPPPPA